MPNADPADRAAELFARHFDRPPDRVASAPGRVNLIGEHIDYCGGFVLPIAIPQRTAAALGYGPAGELVAVSEHATGEIFRWTPMENRAPTGWGRYIAGVAACVGAPLHPRGLRLAIASDVPVGAGLSSSAALELAVAAALTADAAPDPVLLALACQRAEHAYAGVPCGVMDQCAAALARAGHAMLLDCHDLSYRHVQIPPDRVFVVADSGVRHDLSDGAYAAVRRNADAALRSLRERAASRGEPTPTTLRHAAMTNPRAATDALPEELRRSAIHVFGEVLRTLRAATALDAGDAEEFGRLMLASHASLRDNLRVSCPELDALVDHAASIDGVLGARMTGGGFGGSCVALVRRDRAAALRERLTPLCSACFIAEASAGMRLH